jgi:alcohol dehydrogenase, propanol-preferring
MRAVRLHAVGARLAVEEAPAPNPRGTEVLVRVAGCGVCRTDLAIVDGTQPRVALPVTLGHEVAGWIEALGPDATSGIPGPAVGDRVLVFGGWGCGDCIECQRGNEQRCARGHSPGFQADGGYADLLLVPHPRHLMALGSLDPVQAAPLADAGVTPYRAVRRAAPWLRDGARALVIGAGGLGQFAIQHLRRSAHGGTLRIVVSEPDARRRVRAGALGADAAPADAGLAALREALGGQADVVFDLVGSNATLHRASELVAPGGLVNLVGEAGGSLPFGFESLAVESWLTTTAWGSIDDLRTVVAMAQRGELEWSVERVPLNDAQAAHDRLRAGEVDGRLVLVP